MAFLRDKTFSASIDGFAVEKLLSFELEHNTDWDDVSELSGLVYVNQGANVRAKLFGPNMELSFRVEGYEQNGTHISFYGPLREMFPEIFQDIDPSEWQVAYLTAMARPSLDRFKMRRTDQFFKTDQAELFRLGFEAGHTTGAVNERKLAKIAADTLKKPVKTKEDFNGILGKAYRRKVGK
jgi:hypothetical protein